MAGGRFTVPYLLRIQGRFTRIAVHDVFNSSGRIKDETLLLRTCEQAKHLGEPRNPGEVTPNGTGLSPTKRPSPFS